MEQLHAIEQTRGDGVEIKERKETPQNAQAHAAALRRTPGSGHRKATEKSRRFDARRNGGWQARDRATA